VAHFFYDFSSPTAVFYPDSVHSEGVDKKSNGNPHMHGEHHKANRTSKVKSLTAGDYPHIHNPYYEYYLNLID
jgi:hypothetical protein